MLVKKIHENSEIPKKKFKQQKLAFVDKLEHRRISGQRIKIENIAGLLNILKLFLINIKVV